jgi:hypothetical protein
MTKLRAKTAAMAKRKPPVRSGRESKILATGDKTLGKPSGSFWTQTIAPKGAALLSEMLGPIYFIVKNHGSNNLRLVAGFGDLMDLSPGAVRATYARGNIRIENWGKEPALIEFQFLPIHLKP